jgi:hypothetical protein
MRQRGSLAHPLTLEESQKRRASSSQSGPSNGSSIVNLPVLDDGSSEEPNVQPDSPLLHPLVARDQLQSWIRKCSSSMTATSCRSSISLSKRSLP